MIRAPFLAAAALVAVPATAQAGAWLRDPGAGFLSWSIKIQDHDSAKAYGTLYGEFGINPDLTVGLDLGTDDGGDHKALAFVVMPLSRSRLRASFELGAGVTEDTPTVRPGLSVGGEITLAGLGGWWSLDTRAAIRPDDVELSVDATLGVMRADRTMLIAQVQQGGALAAPDTLRLTGSVVWETAPGRHFEVGLTTDLEEGEAFGFKIGVWRSF